MSLYNDAVLAVLPGVLRAARHKAQLTQSQLAGRMNTSLQFIWALEHGRNIPSTETVLRVALATGIPASKILRKAERLADRQLRAERAAVDPTHLLRKAA